MRWRVEVQKLTVGFVVVLAVGLGAPSIALADVTVNTTDDTNAVNPAVGPMDSSGHISLRSAVENANTLGLAETINVPSGTYTLTAAGGSNQGTAGALVLADSSPLTIAGAGASTTTVDANFLDRAFDISSGTVTISGLTVENGRAGADVVGVSSALCPSLPGGVSAAGGAILDQGTLTLTDDTFSGNMSEGNGGAVEDQGGLLTVGGSTFTGNTACQGDPKSNTGLGNGGAIDEATLQNDVTIDSSTISGNSAQNDGGGVAETGIPDPTITVTNSTISDNHADNDGGGIVGEGGGVITLFADLINANTATHDGGGIGGADEDHVTNSTITGNFAGCPTNPSDCSPDNGGSGQGGGLDVRGTATISFSTINDNNAVGGNGGNIESCGDCEQLTTLDDSIVTGGIADGGPNNCDGFGFTDSGHNLFDDNATDCGGPGAGDRANANPNLGLLANNGGPTMTAALQSGSQAIDAADGSRCSSETLNSSQQAVDQRGVIRPQGPQCDIGAYEAPARGGGGGRKTAPSVSTTVFDAGTSNPWAGTESAGASAYDTANLGGTGAGRPSGSVTYKLFENGSCSGTAATTDTETLNSDGSVPHSNTSGALAAGSYSYQASYSGDANYSGATGGCEPFSVGQGHPDLGLTASAETNPIVVGEQDDVTDTITNLGNGPATGVRFSDPAAGFTINSVTPSQGACTHTKTTVSCSLGTIGAGKSATVQILLTANSVGTITLNSAVSMNQADPTPKDNHAATTIRVNPHLTPTADLAVHITPSGDRVPVGQTFVYTLVVANRGPDAGHQVSAANKLPGNVRLISIPRGRFHCHVVNVMSCSLGTLRRGATRRIHLVVRAQGPGLALDKADVSDVSPTDPNLANNRDRATVTLVASSLPTVGVIHLGSSCHRESSTIHLRAVAFASAGIKQVSLAVTGHGHNEGVATAPSPTKTVHRLRFGTSIAGSSLLAGRTYRVVATVIDKLGRHSHATGHFTVCSPPHKRGFTG